MAVLAPALVPSSLSASLSIMARSPNSVSPSILPVSIVFSFSNFWFQGCTAVVKPYNSVLSSHSLLEHTNVV
ncbi:hypothetical protein HN873_024020, partial [Arachis hypogaea]